MSAEKSKKGGEITSYSDWMSQLPAELHTIPLYMLKIPVYSPKMRVNRFGYQPFVMSQGALVPLPGSHDSMTYDLDVNSSIVEPERLRKFSRICCVRKIMRRWATTQNETITKQLDAGVRYFDLRIARKPRDTNPTRLYFCHGLYTRSDVETVLKLINDWAERHPKEIVILALSNFQDFEKKKSQLHNHLISFIKTLFGAKLVTRRRAVPTLKSCWDQGANVIVSYDYPATQHIEIWGKIAYYYGNSMDTTKVESQLRSHLEKRGKPRGFYVCGLNLTLPEDARILLYILRMCDKFTNVVHRSLPRLLQWVKKQAAKTPINIIASDIVTQDQFVSTVVGLNFSKHTK